MQVLPAHNLVGFCKVIYISHSTSFSHFQTLLLSEKFQTFWEPQLCNIMSNIKMINYTSSVSSFVWMLSIINYVMNKFSCNMWCSSTFHLSINEVLFKILMILFFLFWCKSSNIWCFTQKIIRFLLCLPSIFI